MIKFDITSTRVVMVQALGLVVAVRRFFKPMGLDTRDLRDMERDFRAAASELQRVEKAMAEDQNRPLINGPGG